MLLERPRFETNTRPQGAYNRFDSFFSTIDTFASEFPPVEIVLLDDFNIHNTDWLKSKD